MPELTEDTRKLTNYIYVGQKEVKYCLAEFYRFLFSELIFTEDWKWVDNDQTTNIFIETEYPDIAVMYPRIVVKPTPMDIEQLSFKDISKHEKETDVLYLSGAHEYSVITTIKDYAQDPVEDITDRLMLLLSIDIVRKNVMSLYKLEFVVPKRISVTSITPVTLVGTDKKGYESSFRFNVWHQWEAKLPGSDIETIQKEAIKTTVIDP